MTNTLFVIFVINKFYATYTRWYFDSIRGRPEKKGGACLPPCGLQEVAPALSCFPYNSDAAETLRRQGYDDLNSLRPMLDGERSEKPPGFLICLHFRWLPPLAVKPAAEQHDFGR